MLQVFRPCLGQEEIDAVADVIRSGWIGLGPKTAEFEKEFAAYTGSGHAVGLNSCTAALDLAMGDGGAITTSNGTWAARGKTLRWLGIDKGTWDRSTKDRWYWWKYDVAEIGLKCHMNDIAAAIGLVQLKKLDVMNARRRSIAGAYSEAFARYDFLEPWQADDRPLRGARTGTCAGGNHGTCERGLPTARSARAVRGGDAGEYPRNARLLEMRIPSENHHSRETRLCHQPPPPGNLKLLFGRPSAGGRHGVLVQQPAVQAVLVDGHVRRGLVVYAGNEAARFHQRQ